MTGIAPVSTTFEEFKSERSYGVILMSQILEHASDPVAWMKKTHNLLELGGILAIAVPHFDSFTRRLMQEKEFYIIPPEHLNYFKKKPSDYSGESGL